MMEIIIGLCISLAILVRIRDYQNDPYCKWCKSRHQGRCIFMPREVR